MFRLLKPSRLASAASPASHLRASFVPLTTTPFIRAMSSSAKPRFSEGTDEASASPALSALLSGSWVLAKDGEALERSFKFKTFAKTWDFMTAVALQCKINNHHPEWSNVYNTTYIRWTTHSPQGLSAKDLDLAARCDALARDFGELPPEPTACEVRDVADRVTVSAGDCCVPKK